MNIASVKIITVSLVAVIIFVLFISHFVNIGTRGVPINSVPLNYSYSWYETGLSGTSLNFTQDAIDIVSRVDNSEFVNKPNPSLTISKSEFPKLFVQGIANESQINAFQLNDFRDKYNGRLIVVQNEQPSHGGYSSNYFVIVSPFEAQVVFEAPEEYQNGSFQYVANYPLENFLRLSFENYKFDSCSGCNLNFLSIYKYSKDKSKFELANNEHKDEFTKYLTEYEKLYDSGCFYEGKKQSFSDIERIGGTSATCQSSDDYEIDNPISVEKLNNIISKLHRIVLGENISMFE